MHGSFYYFTEMDPAIVAIVLLIIVIIVIVVMVTLYFLHPDKNYSTYSIIHGNTNNTRLIFNGNEYYLVPNGMTTLTVVPPSGNYVGRTFIINNQNNNSILQVNLSSTKVFQLFPNKAGLFIYLDKDILQYVPFS